MPFKSLLSAKTLLVLSLAIGLTSAYLGHGWQTDARVLSSTVTKLQADQRKAKEALMSVEDELTPDASRVNLGVALSSFMLDVYNKRLEHGITISAVTPSRLSATGQYAGLDTFIENVPGTQLASVRVNFSGTYNSYRGLLSYLNALRSHPVALVRLKVEDQSFEASMRIYGNNE